MAGLNADQRNYYYLDEAARTGIHKPILAALYDAHRRPTLRDGETGLGMAPANRVPPEEVSTFPGQVQFAANTIRSMTDALTAQGWKGEDFWNSEQGRYTDRFVQAIASGYNPPASDLSAARLESTDSQALLQAYLEDLTREYRADDLPQNLSYLDSSLLLFIERLPRYYIGLSYQRDALLEAVRIWRKLNTRQAAIASLLRLNESDPSLNTLDETRLDQPLVQFMQQLSPFYAGYPHQREALVRLTQLWRQLDSRSQAIASLQNNTSAETNIRIIDPVLVAFVQRIPQFYQGRGEQRQSLTEAYRLWFGLDSRTTALKQLGVDPQLLTSSNPNNTALVNAAAQLDRALLEFVRRVPIDYQENEQQREALIRLVQIWRRLEGRNATVQALLEDLRRMEHTRWDSPDAPPRPHAGPLPPVRPAGLPATFSFMPPLFPTAALPGQRQRGVEHGCPPTRQR
ncbi:peptidase M15A [Egbenema bharatensis]|uniref:peptidase M15A n=1 Tax=Egbenema bharatensis TaxID=3463334 RepID=UPI003A85EDAB